MIKKAFFLLFVSISTLHSQDIVGFWKTRNNKTGKSESIIGIYEYQKRYYGRILGSFNQEGVFDDNINDPKSKAQALKGTPYYSGLDIVWVNKQGNGYYGNILDPRSGSTYRVEITRDKEKLLVKGKLLFFSGTRVWGWVDPEELPKGFKIPNMSEFIPSIPST